MRSVRLLIVHFSLISACAEAPHDTSEAYAEGFAAGKAEAEASLEPRIAALETAQAAYAPVLERMSIGNESDALIVTGAFRADSVDADSISAGTLASSSVAADDLSATYIEASETVNAFETLAVENWSFFQGSGGYSTCEEACEAVVPDSLCLVAGNGNHNPLGCDVAYVTCLCANTP